MTNPLPSDCISRKPNRDQAGGLRSRGGVMSAPRSGPSRRAFPLSPRVLPWCFAAPLMLLAGCGESDRGAAMEADKAREASAAAKSQPASPPYPPDAAQVLSLVGAGASPQLGVGPFESATNCVVAIRTVKTLLGRLQQNPSEQQLAVLRQAETMYLDRARAEANEASQVAGAIEKKLRAAQGASQAQARIAIDCMKDLS